MAGKSSGGGKDQVSITVEGPMFDGMAALEVVKINREAAEAISKEALHTVQVFMKETFVNPTGYYASNVRIDRSGSNQYLAARKITDSGVIYGPWLEGTSQRNMTTRFKGYANFRRAAQRVQLDAQAIAEAVYARHAPAIE